MAAVEEHSVLEHGVDDVQQLTHGGADSLDLLETPPFDEVGRRL